MINRKEALSLLDRYIKNKDVLRHLLAVEAIMKEIAKKLGEDQYLWGITGLLHDLDYSFTEDDPAGHSIMTAKILKGLIPEKSINAIKSHNYKHTDSLPIEIIDKALNASDIAAKIIFEIKNKINDDMTAENIYLHFKKDINIEDKKRRKLEYCEDIGIPVKEFLTLSIRAIDSSTVNIDEIELSSH
ncbi:MAG: HD domain-containing protein [Candidatus Thermoplasmatota archaeon]